MELADGAELVIPAEHAELEKIYVNRGLTPALAVQARTLEVFEHLGVLEAVFVAMLALANGFVATPVPGHRLSSCKGVSRGAVNRGIYDCGTTAEYAPACWKARARATMYCLQNPFGTTLAEFPLANTRLPGVAVPIVASPLVLVLDDGAHCLLRDGGPGSWPPLPGRPDWLGTYSCNTPNDHILWASSASDGVNRASRTWTVTATGRSSALVSHAVTVAYFAGN